MSEREEERRGGEGRGGRGGEGRGGEGRGGEEGRGIREVFKKVLTGMSVLTSRNKA